jgi:hypothetical protein
VVAAHQKFYASKLSTFKAGAMKTSKCSAVLGKRAVDPNKFFAELRSRQDVLMANLPSPSSAWDELLSLAPRRLYLALKPPPDTTSKMTVWTGLRV